MVYNGKGRRITCDLCGFGNRDMEVRKLVEPYPPPLVICQGCYQRDKAALDQRVAAGRYSVRFI